MKSKSRKSWKSFAIVGAVLVVLGLVTWGIVASISDKVTYEYIKVEKGPLRITLRESAVIGPEHRLTVTPPIPGRIDSIQVANGAAVSRGQVLAWISSTERAALMDSARAAGGQEMKYWEDVYKPAPLIAPLDGHIISTAVVPGQVVVTAQTVFTMSDHLIVQVNVDETDLANVWLGQTVEITFDSFPDAKLTGKVHEIAFDSTTVNNVTTYLVSVYLDSTPSYVRSGISANVFLLVSDRKQVVRIPNDAITRTKSGKTVLVAQAKDQPPAVRKIELGATDGSWTEVKSGLVEGDWLARPAFSVKLADKNLSTILNGL